VVALPIALALLAAQTAGASPQRPPADPTIQIGLFSYRPDGTEQGYASGDLSAESFQYVTACGIGSGNRPVPDEATDAWRVSGKVVSIRADEAIIQLDWQRTRSDGVAVSSPGASVQLTLHPGDRVPLDSAHPKNAAQCPARTIGFEARYDARPFGGGPSVLRRGSGTGGGISGGGGGAGVRGGGGGGATAAATGSISGFGRAVHEPKETADATAAQQFDVDLWLVHSAPGEKEETAHQALARVRGGARFAFAPVTIEIAHTIVNLQVTGMLRFATDGSGARQLLFTTSRSATFSAGAGAGRDTIPSTQGSSTVTSPMPGPDDVLSFELPPVRVPNGGPSIPDQFAVRVRIR
jgi:hypothetical protein